MSNFSEENYSSVNTISDAAEKDWSLTGIFKKSVQQATVQLESGKEYRYACRWPFAEGDVAIIGNTLMQNSSFIEQSSNSGLFGIITYAEPKLTVKRSHAVELDYVFTGSPSKKNITDCAKYLESSQDFKTVQYEKFTENYFPLSFYIRRLLAAASIIAHQNLAAADAVNAAKKYITTPQDFDDMEILTPGPWYPGLDFTDTQINTDGKSLEELEGYGIEAFYDTDDFGEAEVDGKALNSYLNKYALMGAISIMVRGGFVNLLNAFLSAEPPIKGFYDEMIGYLGDTGNADALEIINNYSPQA